MADKDEEMKDSDPNRDGEESEEDVEEQKKFYFQDMLIMVKSAQNQNGLRHNDYGRYHKYCIRKIYRIRKSLKFTQGRKQFIQKVVTAEEAKVNPKYLHLLVFKSEANWAYAMQMKQIISSGGQGVKMGDQNALKMSKRNPNRLKFHAKKRLQKAFQAAQYLQTVSGESLDPYAQIEVEAYVSQMSAVYQMEIKDYKSALDNLLKSKIIYEKIAQYKDTLEAVIYTEKVGQLDTLIRLCSFNVQGGGSAGANEDEIIKKSIQQFPKKKEIEEKISQVKVQTKKEQIEKIDEITHNNKTVPLKTEKLKLVFKRVETQMHDIQEYWLVPSKEFDSGTQIRNYLNLVNILEDATLIIKKEKAEESKRSEASGQIYNVLLNYIQKLKFQGAIDRNILQANSLAKQIDLPQLFSTTKLKSELRPQNVVRFIEKALKAQRSIINMDKDQIDPLKQLEYDFSEKFYSTQIKYFIGLHYANENQYQDSFLILQKVHTDIEETIEFAQKNNIKSQKIAQDITNLKETTLKNLNYLICKCHSKILQSQHEQFQKLQSEMGQMQIDTTKDEGGIVQVKHDNLYDMLFNGAGQIKKNLNKKLVLTGEKFEILESKGSNVQFMEQFTGKQGVEFDKLKLSKQFKLINPVPKFQSVPATPQFFDLAGTYIDYPNLEEAQEKYKAKGGLLSKFKGFWK